MMTSDFSFSTLRWKELRAPCVIKYLPTKEEKKEERVANIIWSLTVGAEKIEKYGMGRKVNIGKIVFLY